MTILITGVAGFIGSRLCKYLLEKNKTIIGVDNLNSYYDIKLKKYRLKNLQKHKKFKFIKFDLSKKHLLQNKLRNLNIKILVHLAAQAGVRYSLENPRIYMKYNIDAFMEILEYCRINKNTKLIYASSSSVYGANKKVPFCVEDEVSKPVSLYAASKRANELMAESYSRLFSLKIIGLRFFTVYGPWGRPDMAIWKFTESILKGEPIEVFNKGNLGRDFTFVDDIIQGIEGAMFLITKNKKPSHSLFNLGNNTPVNVNKMINILEKILMKKSKRKNLPMQPGDVKNTFANIDLSKKYLKYEPETNLKEGLIKFTSWFKEYKNMR